MNQNSLCLKGKKGKRKKKEKEKERGGGGGREAGMKPAPVH